MMSNREKFQKAHMVAREIRSFFGAYRDAFAFALREIYAQEKADMEKTTEQKLIDIGIKAWERGDMRRYYMDDKAFSAVFGLEIARYNSGNICGATLNGSEISNGRAAKLIGQGVFFDAVRGEWYRKGAFGTSILDGELRGAIRI